MAERAVPKPIEVRDNLLVELKKIGLDDETKWRSRPKTVARGVASADVTVALPAILLDPHITIETEAMTNNVHRDVISYRIGCLVEDAHDAELALHDLISDVRRALRDNFTLDGTIMLEDGGVEASVESLAGKAGKGFGIVTARALVETTDTDA